MAAIQRTCRICRSPFEVSDDEMTLLRRIAEEQGWPQAIPPVRCSPCRAETRRFNETIYEVGPEYSISCVDCGDPFTFRTQDQEYYRDRGFRRPRRCPPCRKRRKTAEVRSAQV
jgi:hypothetical protein